MKKLFAYLAILTLSLGVIAANGALAQDSSPVRPHDCCSSMQDDIDVTQY